jgi:hypothetical protein
MVSKSKWLSSRKQVVTNAGGDLEEGEPFSIDIYIYIYIYIYVYIYVYMYMYICNVCIHIDQYIKIYFTHIYTHIHIYIYTYTYM